jgi:nicotinamidase-related amidase
MPILVSEQVPEKLGATVPELLEDITPALRFSKNTFSCFGSSAFTAYLEDHSIEHLILCGIETPICIYQTTLDAHRKGLPITLLTDGLGARRANDARDILRFLETHSIGTQIPAESLFYSLLASTENPHFKAFTRLVKAAM